VRSGENISESSKAKHSRELIVWQCSRSLAKLAYQLKDRFPCVASDVEKSLKEIAELQGMPHAIVHKLAPGSPLATGHSPISQGEAKESF
jgi:hypothetical protein